MGTQDDRFYCPQADTPVWPMTQWSQPNGRGDCACSPTESRWDSIFHQRQLMHLGHPEYNVGRILGEMERDRARGECPLRKTSMPVTRAPAGAPTATCCSSSGCGSAISG